MTYIYEQSKPSHFSWNADYNLDVMGFVSLFFLNMGTQSESEYGFLQ